MKKVKKPSEAWNRYLNNHKELYNKWGGVYDDLLKWIDKHCEVVK